MIKKSILIFMLFQHTILLKAQVNRYQTPSPVNLQSQYYVPPVDNSPSFAEKLVQQRIEQQEQSRRESLRKQYENQIHIYGGLSHKTYLGCLTCSSNDPLSIWNSNGNFGKNSDVLNSEANIWNVLSVFGTKSSDLSPWCITAQNPPVIVDFEGVFYGYFTANINKDKRTKLTNMNELTEKIDKIDYAEMEKSMKN
jgi:hypothetical protein